MSTRLGARQVTAPSGTQWRVGRRWFSARQRPRRNRHRGEEGVSTDAAGWFDIPDLGGIDDIGALIIAFIAIVVIAVVVIPLLLFGVELIIVGLLAAAGLVNRFALGRPWLVQAIASGTSDQPRAWEVKGWRGSGRVIDEVADALAAGLEPRLTEQATEILAPPTPITPG